VFLWQKQGKNHRLAPSKSVLTPDLRRKKIQDRIYYLKKQIRYSKWWVVLFCLVSLGAVIDFRFFPPISEKTRHFLGVSPPATLISIALVIYAFSALILILGHMNTGPDRFRGWSHIGYLSAFYLFYYYAGKLRANFWPVFITGMTILGLESYRVWTVCSEAIRKEEEILASLEK